MSKRDGKIIGLIKIIKMDHIKLKSTNIKAFLEERLIWIILKNMH